MHPTYNVPAIQPLSIGSASKWKEFFSLTIIGNPARLLEDRMKAFRVDYCCLRTHGQTDEHWRLCDLRGVGVHWLTCHGRLQTSDNTIIGTFTLGVVFGLFATVTRGERGQTRLFIAVLK